MALAGHVAHLNADTVWVLEQDGVVAGRKLSAVLWGMHDLRTNLLSEARDRVYVLAAPRPQAEVMEPCAELIKRTSALASRRPAHQNACAAADAVEGVLVLDKRVHCEEVAELLPERQTARRVVDGELDVGDAVQFDTHAVSCVSSRRVWLTCTRVNSIRIGIWSQILRTGYL